MSTKHTPGPWTTDGSLIRAEGEGSFRRIADLGPKNGQLESMLNANARLIASSPELLEVVQAIASELADPAYRLINSNRHGDQSLGNTLSWAVALCENAIAKATGIEKRESVG